MDRDIVGIAGCSKSSVGFIPSMNTGNVNAATTVKHVAIKFKSQIPQFNGSENVHNTPEELISSKYKEQGTARTPNCENIKKEFS
uniref:Uncharacterized protein n=1 Tax=Oryza punctata TaxID=4537 RepID=A0A0E0KEZ7_ORYPU